MNTPPLVLRVAILAFLAATSIPSLAGDLFVQQGVGNDANPGDAWGDGHSLATIGRALTKAARRAGPDTIHVSAGTYPEQLVTGSDVTLLGSYPAGGSGAQNRVTSPSVVDGAGVGIPINIGGANNVVIDRFVVRNGLNNVAGNRVGGGISVVYSAGVTLTNNLIENSRALEWGGGVGILGSTDVTLRRNRIRGNQAVSGGGVGIYQNSTVLMTGNTLLNNTATERGGGLVAQYSSLTLKDNSIRDNQAHDGGGVAWADCVALSATKNMITGNQASFDGGGVLHYACAGVLSNNTIQRNSSGNWGGGVCIRTGAHLDRMANNLITNNTAVLNGGGVSLYDRSSATLLNNTVARNRAVEFGGGLYVDGGASATVKNSILWANTAGSEGPGGNDQITNRGNTVVRYSDIGQGWPGTGNLSVVPGFQLVDDYRLIPASACRDVGTANGAPGLDLVGTPRPQGAGIDMGAYEGGPGPDLTGVWRWLSVSPDGLTLNGAFRAKNLVADQDAGAFKVAFYLSDDGKATVGKPFSTQSVEAGLAGGSGQTLRIAASFSNPVQGRYVLAVVDSARQVAELKERNNRISQLIGAP